MSEQETFVAWLNIDHPMVAWEVAIGRLCSPLQAEDGWPRISLWAMNHLRDVQGPSEVQIANEFRMEKMRREKYGHCVSRLDCLYFFEDIDTARSALKRWGGHRNPAYLSEVSFCASNKFAADSEWISANIGHPSSDDAWMESYWKGDCAGVQPLSEVLAQGFGTVRNIELRNLAAQKIHSLWPTSTLLLWLSACAFQAAYLDGIGQIQPVLAEIDGAMWVTFVVDDRPLKHSASAIADAIKRCEELGYEMPIVKHQNPEVFFTAPDLREYSFKLSDTAKALELITKG